MSNQEIDRTTIKIAVAANRIIECKNQLNNPTYKQTVGELSDLIANDRNGVDVLRTLQKGK